MGTSTPRYVACATALTVLLVACGAGDDQLDSAADRFCGYLEMRYERSPEEGTLADDIVTRASEIDRTPAELHAAIEGHCPGPLETMLRQETTARRGYVLSHQQCSDESYRTSLMEQAGAELPKKPRPTTPVFVALTWARPQPTYTTTKDA